MPVYEYECLDCQHRFEVRQRVSDAPIDTCRKCGAKVRKVFSSIGIAFKGPGFYVNDYKPKSESKASSN